MFSHCCNLERINIFDLVTNNMRHELLQTMYLTIRASLEPRHALFLVKGRNGPPMSAKGWSTAGPLQELEESADRALIF